MLLWKDPLKVEIKSCSAGHIDASIDHNLRRWRFTGFYGSPTVEGRVASWQLMQRLGLLSELCHLPWLVGGDFNEILYDHEKQGGRPRSLSQMQNFQQALDHCCLRNITSMGEFFTWANKQLGSDFIQERLDRYVSTLAWVKLTDVVNGLQRCAKETDAWGFQKYGRVRKQIADLRHSIEAKRTDRDYGPRMLEISHMEENLECLLDKEEIYWKQRSRTDWLTHGDRNSKFFHRKASERKKKNFVEGLRNMEGEWCTGIDNISKAVSQRMNEHLSRPFSGEEILTALAEMPSTKSPGPDGMPGLFFQKYWDIVGEEITAAALLVLNNDGDIHQWNQTLITLIPKIQSPTQVSDFRPISLCNMVYKLVSRTITNRFSRILDEVIGDQQSAFVPGRLITYNVLLGFETMHWLRQHRGGNTGYAALKLDMSKAYDRHRGLRQGDPLSPYLFVICAHGLSEMLACFEERKRFTGIKIASGCPSISHLFFADDSLIFCKANLSEATHLKTCLTNYAKASGQQINFDKSALCFSPNTKSNDMTTVCSVFGVNQVQSHELYLGLPTFSMKNKRIQFGYIQDKVIRKLQGWKNDHSPKVVRKCF
ncbi:hypothetical protein UlMin_022609 [Ulmus minor]